MRSRWLLAIGLLLAPSALPAQTTVSVQAGAIAGEDLGLFEAGVRVSPARINSLGIGVSFDAIPQAFGEGAFLGVTDVYFASNIGSARHAWLELRAGGSALVGVGGGGGGALVGYHVGAGVVYSPEGSVGVRADYTYRRLAIDGETYPLPSFTIGLVLRH